MSEDSSQPLPESGRVYRTVTRYWPRIAAGLVITIGLVEFVVGGITADSGVEFYLMAWAGTTGGLWFLFEKAERALSDESQARVGDWLRRTDFGESTRSIPSQFVLLFDRVFGEKHLSWKCFSRSSVASLCAAGLILPVAIPILGLGTDLCVRVDGVGNPVLDASGARLFEACAFQGRWWLFAVGAPVAAAWNFVPDYLSLLETRWLVRFSGRSLSRFLISLVLDFVLTAALGVVVWMGTVIAITTLGDHLREAIGTAAFASMWWYPDETHHVSWAILQIATGVGIMSTFFTSVWLWLYAASVMVSRVLVRMGGGVGFLLKVTDVEKQPFRSMGFVSVIITSVIFALGLPLVLLG